MNDIVKIEDKLEVIDPFYKLLPSVKKALFMLALGEEDKICRKVCHLSSAKWIELINSKIACNYIKLCRDTLNSKEVIAKEDLLIELVSRISTATNSEVVQLIGQIAKLKGFEVEEGGNTQINISFVSEPFRPKYDEEK
jgi:hypothetical protein